MKKILAATTLATLSACASVPVDVTTAPFVEEVRVANTQFLKGGVGKVPLTVVYDQLRDIGTMSVTFAVDGAEVATLKPGEKLEGFVTEGRHILSTYVGPKKVFLTSFPDVFSPEAGPYTYRIYQGLDGKVGLVAM